MDEKLIEKFMKNFRCTREEAISVIKDDENVDKMTKTSEINADLSDEQKKNIKNVTKTTAKTTKNYKFDKKARPKDEEKVKIIENVADFLKKTAENVEITNAGKEISLKIGENEYSLTLTKHRKSKEE